ncbi:MAG TPA: S41 family peptidase [Longimicrobiaceae bacterium]|nr:S41 family peptidase [Longimicrobiaceae bacterium]
MKLKRTFLGPVLVVLVAFVSGGWLLQRGAGEGGGEPNAQIFSEVFQRVSRAYVEPHPSGELYEMAIEGMLQELGDPHTTFMTADEYNDLRIQTTGEYGGLGIQIAERNGWVTVIAPLPGTPAERAGLLAGDRIVEVEGESAAGWTSDDAVQALRGKKGEPAHIKIGRVGVDEPIPYTIVRDEIHVQSVPYSYLLDEGIGYARLTLFSETSTQELRNAIDELRGKGMESLILDLRMNPGGLLDQGVSVSDLFLEEGEAIVETRTRDPEDNQVFRAPRGKEFPGMMVAVLVDEYSASAAEIVAGALQDHDEALVVGATSFGKGSVQTLFPLSGGNFLKLTTGKWYTPSGRSIQKEPDRSRLGNPVELLDNEPISEGGAPLTAATDSTPPEAREAYRTDSGRIVYGGGGIVPDLTVLPDTLTTAEREFFEAASKAGSTYSDVVYRYAVEFARSTPDLDRFFVVTPAMHEEFFERLTAAGVEVTREQFEGASDLIDQRLGYEIALAAFGRGAASQRATASDEVVSTALELLRQADSQEALFALAERMENQATASR